MAKGLHPARALIGSLLALVATFLAYRAWDDARFAYLRGSDAALAYASRSTDPLSLAKVIDDRIQSRPGMPIANVDAVRVRTALIGAPLSRALLRIVGLKAIADGDAERADVALSMSDRTSRRDGLTQLSLIERSVAKDDMNSAVRHYHAALSVHPELKPALIPILTKAISFPQVRTALAPYFARQAPWSTDLMEDVIKNGNPADLALLIIPVGEMVRGEHYEKLNAQLISRLAESGDFPLAGRLALAVIPRMQIRALAQVAVSDVTIDSRLGGLAWKLFDDDRILATPNGLGGLDIDVEPLARGPVASRFVAVNGGLDYIFSQKLHAASDPSANAMSLNWQAFCLSSQPKAIVWQQMLPNSRQTQRYESKISVPSQCKGLELVLNARGPEGQQSAHAAIEALDLRPRSN